MEAGRLNFVSYHLLMCFVCALCVNVDFHNNRDGFFLKSPYHKFKPAEPNIVKESFILTRPDHLSKLRASYGPFKYDADVPDELLSTMASYGESFDKSETKMHRQETHNMDVSAHLLSRHISLDTPLVQVLVHALPLPRRASEDAVYRHYGVVKKWCAQIFVSRGKEEALTTACLLNSGNNACVAGLSLPESWWWGWDSSNASSSSSSTGGASYDSVPRYDQGYDSDYGYVYEGSQRRPPLPRAAPRDDILVFYSILSVDQNQECASVSNSIVPARPHLNRKAADERKFISTLELIRPHAEFTDLMDKKGLVFRIPDNLELRPGVRFTVPVLLEKNMGLKEFVAKVKVRGNLMVEGATTPVDSLWSVFFETGDELGTATVTARLKEDVKYTRSFRVEEIMRWQFHVVGELGPVTSSTSRVSWTIDYQRNGLSRNSYFPPENSYITAKFKILPSITGTLVPVLKERSLLNTAILTGQIEMYSLHVYLVKKDNSLKEVTKDSNCRSIDPEALKVSTMCSHVYLDGSETRGAKNVTIHVRRADQTTSFGVRVWVPEPRLNIQFSDSKLSQIRGWKVRRLTTARKRKKRESLKDSSSRPTDPLLGLASSKKDKGVVTPFYTCRYKYQQAVVEVYARFVISLPGESPRYYRNRKTYVRVTDHVANKLQVSNRRVAKIVGSTVQGVSPGKADVQVISPTGKLMGSREIRVGKDKVEIERLMVRIISGMKLVISQDRSLPGALLATVFLYDYLGTKMSMGARLDIAVEFKDGTMLPLADIDPSEYELKVISVNPKVVEVAQTALTPGTQPRINAVGNGKGDFIKVVLRENSTCQRKKRIRSLDTEYVHVDSSYEGLMVGDQGGNKVNMPGLATLPVFAKAVKEDLEKHGEPHTVGRVKEFDVTKFDDEDRDDDQSHYQRNDRDRQDNRSNNDLTSEPDREALIKKPVNPQGHHPSPLEIGMYVLVAVFLFAILVFTANCAVFMVRYQRKRGSPKGSVRSLATSSVSQAPDWVWIGRATLERNGARNTGCNQPLMAEEDFNGNQMVIPNNPLPPSNPKAAAKKTTARHSQGDSGNGAGSGSSSSSGVPSSSSSSSGASSCSGSNRHSGVSTYKGSECSIRITSNPIPDEEDSGMGYNEAEWDYEAMGMTYEQLMDYFANLKESSA